MFELLFIRIPPEIRKHMMLRIRNADAAINGEEVLRAVDTFPINVELYIGNGGKHFLEPSNF